MGFIFLNTNSYLVKTIMLNFYIYIFYNTNMKLFGYSISLNVLILIGILYLIMVVNALSGSCNREGLTGKEVQERVRKHK